MEQHRSGTKPAINSILIDGLLQPVHATEYKHINITTFFSLALKQQLVNQQWWS